VARPEPSGIDRIVEQWQAGVEPAENFRRLFDHYYWPVLRFFARRGFSTAECEDLCQETFLYVYRALSSFRGESRFEHWLFRIALSTAHKWLRERKAQKRGGTEPHRGESTEEVSEAHLRDPAADPLERALAHEGARRLRAAIDELPPKMRRCVRLRLFHGLLYGEVAELLQITEATVKVQLFKARKRLRQRLGDTGDLDL
jgi:RNA polymerase sigma-70 factor (ECF subfamily)